MPKKTKVTTRDIAKQCGVSQTTVSLILSKKNTAQFTDETIQKVLDTASRMDYIYKPRTPKQENLSKKTILIMCPALSSEYYTILIRAITFSAKKKGLYTMVGYTMREEEREEYYLKLAVESEYYGIIYTYAPKAISYINEQCRKQPFVLINDFNPSLKVPLIALDSKKSGKIVGDHLLSLGHKHIAYVSTPLNPTEIPRIKRLDGLRESFSEAGLSPENVEIVELTNEQWENITSSNSYYEAGYQLTMQLFSKGIMENVNPITAFVGTCDAMCFGILDALKKLGFSIPKDFSVCGFDNILASSFSGISLTTIDHSMDEKGKIAIEMLIRQKEDLANHEDLDKVPLMRLEYEPKLLIRHSTGRARNR